MFKCPLKEDRVAFERWEEEAEGCNYAFNYIKE
jgi:hypothetical protein